MTSISQQKGPFLVTVVPCHQKRLWFLQSLMCPFSSSPGWVNVEWNLFWDLTGSSEIVMKVGLLFFISICLKSRCFSSLRHPGFVSVTDIKPQKLLNAGRNCSRLSTAEQAALGAGSFETGTMGNNAVRRLCFLEARKDIAATGKLYIFISGCSVLWYIVKC